MKNPYVARVDARAFLNLPGFHDGAYVVCYVEDTSERGLEDPRYGDKSEKYNPQPRFILEIADCGNRINLEFEIDSALRRKNSFHKIDTLISALQEFRAGMAEECAEFKARERVLKAYDELKEQGKGKPTTADKALRQLLLENPADATNGNGKRSNDGHRPEDIDKAIALLVATEEEGS